MLITVIVLIWIPHRKAIPELDEVGIFGGLGFLILTGLVCIGMTSEKRSPIWIWYGLAALPIAWLIGWGMLRMSQIVTTRTISSMAGISLLSFSGCVLVFWTLRRQRESMQRLGIRVLILTLRRHSALAFFPSEDNHGKSVGRIVFDRTCWHCRRVESVSIEMDAGMVVGHMVLATDRSVDRAIGIQLKESD
jgi:hypothetical protein